MRRQPFAETVRTNQECPPWQPCLAAAGGAEWSAGAMDEFHTEPVCTARRSPPMTSVGDVIMRPGLSSRAGLVFGCRPDKELCAESNRQGQVLPAMAAEAARELRIDEAGESFSLHRVSRVDVASRVCFVTR